MRFRIKDLLVSSVPEKQNYGGDQCPGNPCTYCTGCTNCSYCSGCTGCSNCTECTNCTGCTRCTYITPGSGGPLVGGGLTEYHLSALRGEMRNSMDQAESSVKEPESRQELEMLEAKLSEALDDVRSRLKNLKD